MAQTRSTPVRERLSKDTIVVGALSLADREGLDAVTIRRLAQDLGVTPMALYWHFRDKDELLDGVGDRLLADVRLTSKAGATPWDGQLRSVLSAVLDAVRPHPTVAALTLRRVFDTEPGLDIAERILTLLRAGGFDAEQAAEMGTYLVYSVITLVTSEPGSNPVEDPEAQDAVIRRKQATLAALSPKKYPNLIASAPALACCANSDSYFRLGIDLLVQGARGVLPA